MAISPTELRNQEFSKKMRGYDPDEVEAILEGAALRFENLIAANTKVKQEVKSRREQLKKYEGIEQTLKETPLTSQQAAEEQKDAAAKIAKAMTKESEIRGEEILSRSRRRSERLLIESYIKLPDEQQLTSAGYFNNNNSMTESELEKTEAE